MPQEMFSDESVLSGGGFYAEDDLYMQDPGGYYYQEGPSSIHKIILDPYIHMPFNGQIGRHTKSS